MKTEVLLAAATLALALASVQAIPAIPKEHRARFLQERVALEDTLNAWKASDAGIEAKKNGFYHPDPHESTTALNGELSRLYLTKLSIEKAQRANPRAVFDLFSPFTMMTDDEFMQFITRSGSKHEHPHFNASSNPEPIVAPHRNLKSAAASKDWSTTKCMAPIKNQAKCGGCWAFAVISTMESALCIATGQSVTPLSEQELISCDMYDSGCGGGSGWNGNYYIMKSGGISTEASYPFTSADGTTGDCSTAAHTKVPISIAEIRHPSTKYSAAEFQGIIDHQPLLVSITADPILRNYKSGILDACSASDELTHDVVVVGYDAESFKIRNSWGAAWGENGYFRIARKGDDASCGMINTYATYPVLAEPTYAPGPDNGAPRWGQCGGINWNGPKTCKEGRCVKQDDYYSQCQ